MECTAIASDPAGLVDLREPAVRDDYDDLMTHLEALDDVELPRVEADIRRMEDAANYEAARDAEPDCRDEDGPEIERLLAEMEVDCE
jgi:hypothetical protein